MPSLLPRINSINKGMNYNNSQKSLSQASYREEDEMGAQTNKFGPGGIQLPESFLVPIVLRNTN